MEPFELAHRPVDVFNMRVTFFLPNWDNLIFGGHISCFTLGNQMARDSVQGHHVIIADKYHKYIPDNLVIFTSFRKRHPNFLGLLLKMLRFYCQNFNHCWQ